METSLAGKIALVTGGNSGIGRAAALALAEHRANVIVSARRQNESEAVVEQIRTAGGQAEFVQNDVARARQVKDLVEGIVERHGGLDYAFSSTGTFKGGPVYEMSEQDWDEVCNINLKGVWLCMKYQEAQMLRQGAASSSTIPPSTTYPQTPTPRPIRLQTRCIGADAFGRAGSSRQKHPRQRRLPGISRTPLAAAALDDEFDGARIMGLSPMKRRGQPAEIAAAVVWVCSDAASLVTGQTLSVDGGVIAGLTPSH